MEDHEIELDTAVEQYLNDRADDLAETTVVSRRFKLNRWLDWMENSGITSIESPHNLGLDEYEEHLTTHCNEATVRCHIATLKQFKRYLAFEVEVREGE